MRLEITRSISALLTLLFFPIFACTPILLSISISQSNYYEQDSSTPLSEAEAIDLVKTVFASATERDIYTVILFHYLYNAFPYSKYVNSNSEMLFIDRVTNSKSLFLMPMVFVVNTWISEKISLVIAQLIECCSILLNSPSAYPSRRLLHRDRYIYGWLS